MQGVQEAGRAHSPRPKGTGSPRVPWSHRVALLAQSHPEEIAGDWAGRGALSGEVRNKLAQFYTKKVHKVSGFDKTVPAAFLPAAQCSGGA